MAVGPLYLTDKSALARMGIAAVSKRIGPLLVDGLVATCPLVDLEILYSSQSFGDYEQVLAERNAIPSYPINEMVTHRAVEVQHELARDGHHRLPIPDLLIAAVAELNDLAVMHYDADFDRISAVTRQQMTWVAPRGSL